MEPVTLIVWAIIILAIFAIAWAIIKQLSLPPFAMTVLYVVAGLIAILFLASFLPGGPHLGLSTHG